MAIYKVILIIARFHYPECQIRPSSSEGETGPLHREGTSTPISGSAAMCILVYDDNKLDLGGSWKYKVSLAAGEPTAGRFQADFRICDESQKGQLKADSPVACLWLFTTRPVRDTPTAALLVFPYHKTPGGALFVGCETRFGYCISEIALDKRDY